MASNCGSGTWVQHPQPEHPRSVPMTSTHGHGTQGWLLQLMPMAVVLGGDSHGQHPWPWHSGWRSLQLWEYKEGSSHGMDECSAFASLTP